MLNPSSVTIPCVFDASGDPRDSLLRGLDRVRAEAAAAVLAGASILVLSDRAAGREQAAIPSLLATGAVHHHLIREGLRMRCGLVVETGEAREVAHFALLIGYGAGAINPYLAFQTIRQLVDDGTFVPADLSPAKAQYNYVKAVGKGLLKIFAKMGISTLHSRASRATSGTPRVEPIPNLPPSRRCRPKMTKPGS